MKDVVAAQITELRESLDQHREELRVARDAIEELREAVQYLANNLPDQLTWTEFLRNGLASEPGDCGGSDHRTGSDADSSESHTPAEDSSKEEPLNGRARCQRRLFSSD